MLVFESINAAAQWGRENADGTCSVLAKPRRLATFYPHPTPHLEPWSALNHKVAQCAPLSVLLDEAITHLYCADVQRTPSDDKIIMDHLHDALTLLRCYQKLTRHQ